DGTRLLRCAGAVRDGGPRPAGGDAVMERRTVGAGLAGGLVAGAAVGAAEALAVWLHAHGAGEVPAFGWALTAYGLIGAAGGLGLGILAAILGTDGFALAFAVVGFGLAGIVGRFRVIRDVFLEQMPSGIVPLAVQAAAALLLLGVAAGVWRALAGASARRRAATRPGIAAVIVGVLALLGAAAARLVPAPAPVAPPARARLRAHAVDVQHDCRRAEVVRAEVKGGVGSSNARRQRFFLLAHYMDPHDPYFVHPFHREGHGRVANPNPPPSVAALYRRLY